MQMRKRLLTLIITTLTVSQIIAQITPYERPYEVNKVSRVGDYPKIKEVKPWDGRTAGDYSIKIQLKGLQEGEIVFLADHHIGGKYLYYNMNPTSGRMFFIFLRGTASQNAITTLTQMSVREAQEIHPKFN